MALTAFDHDMIHHAMHRGPVFVEVLSGRRVSARLIAWRKQRHGCHTNYARVQFPSGRFASVHIDQVTLPEGVISERRTCAHLAER